uniref:C-type lectin domain-containing protein n=1 Tax=Poecilia latipinna TaxID=48699 RepID=A0A3B3VTH5_9TELE
MITRQLPPSATALDSHLPSVLQLGFLPLSSISSLSHRNVNENCSNYILLKPTGQCCFMDCQLYQFLYINENKTWTEAQQYCRENHTDLVTVTNMKDMKRLINISAGKMKEAWIGLYDETHDTWRWSDGSNSSFRHWNKNFNNPESINDQCAMTVFDDGGRWKNVSCDEKKPFVCYDGEFLPTGPHHPQKAEM